MYHGWGGMWLGPIFGIILIAIVVYLILTYSRKDKNSNNETPLEILKKRYARGEITKEQYASMKKDIS